MDIELLRSFSTIAQRGSFAAVAREEGVDPSSVSRRIGALEAEVGVRLFDRTTRRLNLTEAGRLYLERVRTALDALDEAADAARDAISDPSGLLRVTTSVAFGERWLMPRITSFREAHPRVEIGMRLTDAVVDIAAEGIDVALRLGREVEGAFVAARLFDVRYRAVASPGYLDRAGRPDRPADLARHDGILFALPRFGSAWRFRGGPEGPVEEVRPRPALAISNALAIRRAALDGLGVALLADWTIRSDLASGDLVDLFPALEGSATDFDAAAWVVYQSRSYVPARLRAFVDHLRAHR
ncbi:LysR family transcriptional regulator [Jannaschia aquimarina]|uniref:LysR family transcriptional regulator n=1 Tax=Jannaschia aquimarina TaxID=935700 RepID=UPI0005C72F0D|nr:LysR family transcriptional regulator [Jannaschia aquimarina]